MSQVKGEHTKLRQSGDAIHWEEERRVSAAKVGRQNSSYPARISRITGS